MLIYTTLNIKYIITLNSRKQTIVQLHNLQHQTLAIGSQYLLIYTLFLLCGLHTTFYVFYITSYQQLCCILKVFQLL